MLLFYGGKNRNQKKVACKWLFIVLVKKKKQTIECIFFSQYPEAGITLMCLLLHMKLRGDTMADSSLSEYESRI